MTLNFPGPYQVRIFYTTTSSSVAQVHMQALNLFIPSEPDPGTAFVDITPAWPAGGTPTTLKAAVDLWVVSMKAMLSSGGGNTIDRAELWGYEDESFDAHFISAYTIGVAGTSGSAIVPAGQVIVTMRTTNGGVFKLSFMETVFTAGFIDSGSIALAPLETLVAAIETKVYPWCGRDNGYPFVRIAAYPGINEALWKKRYRTA